MTLRFPPGRNPFRHFQIPVIGIDVVSEFQGFSPPVPQIDLCHSDIEFRPGNLEHPEWNSTNLSGLELKRLFTTAHIRMKHRPRKGAARIRVPD